MIFHFKYTQILQRQLDRLTTTEQTVIQEIAKSQVTIAQLQKLIDLSSTEILDALQSLDRRGLLQKNTANSEIFFNMPTTLKHFLANRPITTPGSNRVS
jgi:predicted transcriptional regulator